MIVSSGLSSVFFKAVPVSSLFEVLVIICLFVHPNIPQHTLKSEDTVYKGGPQGASRKYVSVFKISD